jgi:PhnB protein
MPSPPGYHTITPYLLVPDVDAQLDFVQKAFGATLTGQPQQRDGHVAHAEVQIGDSRVMMGRAMAEWPAMPCMLYMYVDDADALHARALAAGATLVREVRDEPYGDRAGGVKDASGNQWWMAHRLAPPTA